MCDISTRVQIDSEFDDLMMNLLEPYTVISTQVNGRDHWRLLVKDAAESAHPQSSMEWRRLCMPMGRALPHIAPMELSTDTSSAAALCFLGSAAHF